MFRGRAVDKKQHFKTLQCGMNATTANMIAKERYQVCRGCQTYFYWTFW